MIISQVTIHNFRSILHQSFTAYDYMLLVGSNNSGKTTVLDCLRTFYEKDKYSYNESRDFPKMHAQDEESWIDIIYTLSQDEFNSLEEEYRLEGNRFHVRKYFKTEKALDDKKTAKGVILPYLHDGSIKWKAFCSATDISKGKLGTVIFIPAVNKVEDYTKLSGPSAMRDLIASIMTDVLVSNPVYEALQSNIAGFGRDIMKSETEDGKSLKGFEAELNSVMVPWGAGFGLQFSTPSAADIVKNMLGWSIKDNNLGKEQEIDSYGSGLQRHFIFSTIRIGSSYIRQPAKEGKGFSPTLNLLLFEEPEAFLHPSQQLSLAEDLRKLSTNNGWQVICSTHSSHFVSKNMMNLTSIVHLVKQGTETKLYQIQQPDLIELTEMNKALKAIAEKWENLRKRLTDDDFCQEMDALKYFMYFNSERASVFFSPHVLLVEGPSEVVLINRLRDLGKLKFPETYYVMDCFGKFNLHRFMNLFSMLGITHSVLFDTDDYAREHADLNHMVCDAANDFTKNFAEIPGDLESCLGIPKCNYKDKKPQVLLYALEKGRIGEEKLDAFCKIVEGVFIEHT